MLKPTRDNILFIALFGLVVLSFWSTLLAFHGRWASTTLGYSHGYPVLFILLYVLYERFPALRRLSGPPLPILIPIVFAASLIWLAAGTIQVQIVQQLVLPAILLLWLGGVFGWAVLLALLTPFSLIYLAVPVWDVLVLPLRQITVAVVQSLLKIGEYPAYIDGFNITVPMGKFVVAGGCSGLNYFLTSMTLGIVYSVLYLKSNSRRLIYCAVCLFFSLLVNWIRVFALVLIGYYTDMKSEMIADHEMFGWILFACVLVPMFWIGGKLEQPSLDEAKADKGVEGAIKRPVIRAPLWLVFAMSLAAISGPLIAEVKARKSIQQPLALGVSSVQGWRQEPAAAVEEWPHFSGFDRRESWVLSVNGEEFRLKIVYYDSQTQGKELVYDGNRIVEERAVISTADHLPDGGIPLSVREEVIRQGSGVTMVWWVYWVAGSPYISDWSAKLGQLRGLAGGDAGAALVAFEVQCGRKASDCDARREHMKAVVAATAGPWLH